MDLSPVLTEIRALPAYRELCRGLEGEGPVPTPLRLLRSARTPVAAALAADLRRPIVLLLSRPDRLLSLAEEIPAWAPHVRVLPFPDPRPLFYEKAYWGPRTTAQRVTVLSWLTPSLRTPDSGEAEPGAALILTSARAVMARTVSPRDFLALSRSIRVGSSLRLDRILRLLFDAGYAPASLVSEPGQYCSRGGILDVWCPADPAPARIELFGDEVESLRRFDPASQRSSEPLDALMLTPAREGLPRLYQEAWNGYLPSGSPDEPLVRAPYLEFFLPLMNPASCGLFDFLPPETILLFDDLPACEEAIGEQEESAVSFRREQVEAGLLPDDFPLPYQTLSEIRECLDARRVVDLGRGTEPGLDVYGLAQHFSPGPRFGGELRPALDHLHQAQYQHETVVVVSRQAARLSELWSTDADPSPPVDALPASLAAGEVHFVQGALTEGWVLDRGTGDRLHVLTDAEVFGWGRPRPRPQPRPPAHAPEAAYADLHAGDWVVHVDYGVARFSGLVERTLDELTREYLLLEFAEGDQLFVPVHQADRITRYVGPDEAPPSPSRLGTADWERTKGRARQAAEEVARDLLELYARRAAAQGFAFSPDGAWQRELESSFPYAETDDQLRAIAAVKHDMEQSRPMDRLICGDVGYGKTEVALRAAFKAVLDGRQVAMLVPTTVLAQQHFDTFRQRLAPFPVEVEMLSRFRTRGEAEAILERLTHGEVDIVIGTHRLLQRDVAFKELGLVIIDEEQRFGVTHKEHLKQLRTEVDVLTLTATPIPRTLYLAISGVKDVSTINTAPEERLPVITHVGPYEPRHIRQAILREIERNGQVFFVHNRIQTIDGMRARLERLVPEARLAVAHGQVPERELARVMEAFNAGEIDVLLSTSIIESGLDIPNANTLIVDRADTFGLSQLYQLRGRVGRGAARAYAYFFRHPRLRPTEEAAQRLEVIADQTELGAGYSIAMRDLEMRGAGEILGTRQHGHIAAIGFHLYIRLLAQAVRRLRGTHAAPELPRSVDALPVSIDLPLPSGIPADYVPDRDFRLQIYRRLAELRSDEELDLLAAEFHDRFGPLPVHVENLVYQLRLKLLAARAGIDSVTAENGQILLAAPQREDAPEPPDLGVGVRRSKRGFWVGKTSQPGWRQQLLEVLTTLADSTAEKPGMHPPEGALPKALAPSLEI